MANSPSPSTNKQPEKPASSTPASKAPAKASPLATVLKAYWLPLSLLALSLFFQLVILPQSYPPSHYDVLGIRRASTIAEVKEAYENFSSNWNSGIEPQTDDFVKIRYAYELLSNELWKRDYDLFCIDEKLHVLEEFKQLYAGESYSRMTLPLLDDNYSANDNDDLNFITSNNFQSVLADNRPILIQVYSRGSPRSGQFSSNWKRIATLLGDIANTGVVEVGEVNLAAYFADKKATGQPFFRNGLPLLVAFPQGCRSSSCLARYEGDLSVDAVTDWFSTAILKLPRIPYYSKETLGPKFLAKSGHHKVKVIFFSETGMRATPLVRQIAKAYQDYASFAFVLWREEEFSFWWSVYDIESAPATIFVKDPGTKPVIHYGPVNSSWFLNAMEENKLHELAQLRTLTSMELGCDARGYSRAGADTKIWYCVVLIGRPGPDMNQRRD
ncbi:dnaJ homolog subfamily C member 16-like, partial [Phyllobates terribilis]|uniref:dnaJ homolog subfamily C member 16-like n=1 Tax=Phyllobates terribilis TaxID=111132 RepID=UPI003CCA99CF